MSNITFRQRGFVMLAPRKSSPAMPWSEVAPVPTVLTTTSEVRHEFTVGKASDITDESDQTPVINRVRNMITLA